MLDGTQRTFVQTRRGRIHVAGNGTGFPVLLLHQTPRSWDEYRDVLPILGRRYRAIAMDTVGFGDSERAAENSIESWSDAAFALLDALDIEQAAIVGHHTGAVIALEMAASQPGRAASSRWPSGSTGSAGAGQRGVYKRGGGTPLLPPPRWRWRSASIRCPLSCCSR